MYIDIKNNTPGKVPEVLIWWGWWDLNPHDLWSADFESAASAIPPQPRISYGANGGNRTHDLFITSELLYP